MPQTTVCGSFGGSLICFKGVSKSVQVLLDGIEAVLVRTFRYHIPSIHLIYHVFSIVYQIVYTSLVLTLRILR